MFQTTNQNMVVFFNVRTLFKSFDDFSMAKITVSQKKQSFTTTWQILDEPCKQE